MKSKELLKAFCGFVFGFLLAKNVYSTNLKQDIVINNYTNCMTLEEKIKCDQITFISAKNPENFEFYRVENNRLVFLGIFNSDMPLLLKQENVNQKYAYKKINDQKINYFVLTKTQNGLTPQEETIYLRKNESYNDGLYLVLQVDKSGNFSISKYEHTDPKDFSRRVFFETEDIDDYVAMDEYDMLYSPYPFMSFKIE